MYKDGKICDKDGVPLSKEDAWEYMCDLFSGGIPMSLEYAKNYLWPKWGERLGIPKPE